MRWRYQKAVYSSFCMDISQWESFIKSWCRVCLQSIKNHNVSTIQSDVYNATKKIFCVNMWQWMKHEFTTSLRSQKSSQLSEQQQVKAFQSDQRRKHQQARFWPVYFGMRKVFCSPITLGKEEPSIVNII